MFPEKQPSKATIILNDGTSYSAYLEYPKGDYRQPMTEEELEIKFNSLSDGLLSNERQSEIKEMIFSAEKFSAKDFMNKLTV